MIRRWVLNASPLILLGKAELLGKIGPLADAWVIPCGVLQEVAVKSPVDSYLKDLSVGADVMRVDVAEIDPFVAGWDLGRGESEVISIALRRFKETGAVLDDFQARRCAKVLAIPLIGSVGLILRAKREKMIPLAKPAIERLISVGLYIDSKTVCHLLKAVGEQPLH